jgi:hypothetical protein
MAPKTSPRAVRGAHITDCSFRFTTEDELDHSASCSASATTSGWRVCTTRCTMESETRSTASSTVPWARLRAAFTE